MSQSLFLSLFGPTIGQEPFTTDGSTVSLVGNLESGNSSSMSGTFKGSVASLGDQVLFRASGEDPPGSGDANDRGIELWSYDGNTVSLFHDINVGAGSSSPTDLNVVGNRVFFLADDDGPGGQPPDVRVTDGASPSQIVPGFDTPTDIAVFGDQAVVRANTATTGDELFLTDGTFAGTTQVTTGLQDFELGADDSIGSINGLMLINADDGSFNDELWIIDPTGPTPTQTLVNINPAGSSEPREFTNFNGQVFFSAENATSGRELFVSNGTVPVDPETPFMDIVAGAGDSNPQELTVFNGQLYFAVDGGGIDDELWVTNGIPGAPNTRQVVDVNPFGDSNPANLTVVGNHLVFAATQGGGGPGREIFASDGTDDNAFLLADINSTGNSNPGNFTLVGDTLYFTATGDSGLELWQTDGTPAGTMQVPIAPNTSPVPLAAIDVNVAPTAPTLSGNTVAENAAGGTTVGTLASTDADGDPITYALSDDAGGLFQVVGNQLQTTVPLDFEAAASHSVTATATDPSGESASATFTINVTDVNETPTAPILSDDTVEENSPDGTLVGTLSSTDPDGTSVVYSLLDDAGGRFRLNGNRLEVDGPIDFESTESLEVEVRASDGSLFADETFTIDVIDLLETEGTSGRDRFRGTGDGDLFDGLGGNDNLRGRGGDDSLEGSNGKDRVVGNGGDDELGGGRGKDNMSGGGGDDTMDGGGGSDTMKGGGGDDSMEGGGGSDDMNGNRGDDSMSGSRGKDDMDGSGGDDTVEGGGGRDTIEGGRGDDELSGGNGPDTFVFGRKDGTDTITDFEVEKDLIDLSGAGVSFDDLEIEASGSDTVIRYDGRGEITLSDVDATEVTEDVFLF